MTSTPPRADALDVFYGPELLGTLRDTSPLTFEYVAAWLNRPDGAFPLSTIALQAGLVASPAVQAFFENLLPEGDLRVYLAEQRKASTLFSLLLEVAGDTAGAFVMLPHGETPKPPAYEATTWTALAAVVRNTSAAAIQLQGENTRISLAGAQDKASIALFDGDATTPFLPQGSAPSTHILKPDIRRLAKIRESAANEAIIMRTAAHCGLATAKVFYEPLTHACVVERFDRFKRGDGTLGRLIQYDFCQIAGIASEKKYEKEGGPGVAQCARIIRQYSSSAALDLRAFVQWIFLNLFVGNNDSHAKNLSIYQRPGEGTRLTPFYDLMCTRIYPGLSKEFAFRIGGEVLPGDVGKAQVDGLAAQIGMGAKYLQSVALSLAAKIPDAIDKATHEIHPQLAKGGQAFAEKLAVEVKSQTRRAAARIDSSLAKGRV